MIDWLLKLLRFRKNEAPMEPHEPLPDAIEVQEVEEPIPSVVEAHDALLAVINRQGINTRLIEPYGSNRAYRSKHYPRLHIEYGAVGYPYVSSVYGNTHVAAPADVQQKVAWDVLSTYPHRHLDAFAAYFHNTYDIYDCPTFVVETWDKKHRWTGSSPYAIAYEWREIP